MTVSFIGVRHHSPACARLVRRTIEALRPAYVLIEGPADINGRLGELTLGHDLPVAVFTHYRDDERAHLSWTPFCAYSPEWVALTAGQAAGAQVRFIDLPAWHPAFADRSNRYADAEQRYADVMERLCGAFAVDNVDVLWDHMVEVEPDDELERRLETYFDLVRGEASAGESDTAREAYMAGWVRAAEAEAGDRPVVVVSGGFHRPALKELAANGPTEWPQVPLLPDGAKGGSYLVPYSFRRLDSFTGYQSGMPSPEYYQRLWESGPEGAAAGLTEVVVARLRKRKQYVSTADLIAARTLTEGLARLRGHRVLARTDLLDGLVAALVSDDLEQPLPWTRRGTIVRGTHPVVAAMVAALSGDRVGRLHPDTPAPPLVHDVTAELERLGLDHEGTVTLSLGDDADLARSRVLHRLSVLGIPGVERDSGPAAGDDPTLEERWTLTRDEMRLSALIEAGAHGATLLDAAAAVLGQRTAAAGTDMGRLGGVLFDTALCGCMDLSDEITKVITASVGSASDVAGLGGVLATSLGLWRHDRLLGTARSALLGTVVELCVTRVLWLVEGVRGGPAPADLGRLNALAATRDALVHAAGPLGLDRDVATGVARRISLNAEAPPDLRGGAFGLGWSLGDAADPVRAVRGAAGPHILGDWLAGLFALAREEVLTESGVLTVLDEMVSGFGEEDFLVALPALRQAFEYFPPRERETIAKGLLDLRGLKGSARSLLKGGGDPLLIAEARALEEKVERLLAGEGLS
ncbi:hypothetical protein J4573_26300 [Actinomadura barringtoniae]|uniref:Uncharacterized protein n=1 Tax=Actinomadura barringtoniae TaxID=1427535 RepID=A0A939PD46_9ACTN|nr:DUF5682 family protein [Actinomadura barringtoniae]MBO2450642.1 hypothetical protein [Actinomadura barringtoniae]